MAMDFLNPEVLTRKAGPLPIWAYAVGAGGLLWFVGKRLGNRGESNIANTPSTIPAGVVAGFRPTIDIIAIPPSGPPSPSPPSLSALSPTLIDPTTGRPIHSGPGGEGGHPWQIGTMPKPGFTVWRMPDGRWSQYEPGKLIQNGNRMALGLVTDPRFESLAPGANPDLIVYPTGATA